MPDTALLVCPRTRTPLRWDAGAGELVSDAAGIAYPVRGGVPVLLVEEGRQVQGSGRRQAGRAGESPDA